jgi:lipoprotein NlpI
LTCDFSGLEGVSVTNWYAPLNRNIATRESARIIVIAFNLREETSNVIRKLALCACLLLGTASAAMGQSRQESLNKCRSVHPDVKITGCTALIQAGQDTKENLSVIYNNRGAAYDDKRDYDHAIQDYNEAIRLNPKLVSAYSNRGFIYFSQFNLAATIEDYEHVIFVSPSSKTAVLAAVMLHVAMKRQGSDGVQALSTVAAAADPSTWPGPVLKLDLGQITADEVMAVATNASAEKQKWEVCEANYFTGEDALFRHQRVTAMALLKAARDGCPKADGVYGAALAELKRLEVPAAPTK